MDRENERIGASRRQERQRLRARYRQLHDDLVEILVTLDPLGIHAVRPDALAPEATTILTRLRDARVADDVEHIVVEELHRWYGRRRITDLDPDRLADSTIAICTVWNHFLNESAG